MAQWEFYGRRHELAEIDAILDRKRFFFCAVSGRRRIGKTSLIQEAMRRRNLGRSCFYVQIPDSDPRGVLREIIQSFTDQLRQSGDHVDRGHENQKINKILFNKFGSFESSAASFEELIRRGMVVTLDEFQYFNRKSLSSFQSALQAAVDRLRQDGETAGGLFTLGSIHTEMTAILEDRNAPLFNRVTDRILIGHWDFETLFEMFRKHGIRDRHHQLFLWTLFEGVPKFYRDCFDHGVLVPDPEYRRNTIRRLFLEGSSPLRDEAENWFLRELRGRYDTILNLLAARGPVFHGDIKAEYDALGIDTEKQLGGYLQTLTEKYGIVEKLQPMFAGEKGRKARYYIADNFLAAWLGALQRGVKLARVRPLEVAVSLSDSALMNIEGFAFERLVRQGIEECSRKGKGIFPVTEILKGYWNKWGGENIEIDIVALNETEKTVTFGSCKRSERQHGNPEESLDAHIARFMRTKEGQRLSGWTVQRALFAPVFSPEARAALEKKGYLAADLNDFERWLYP